MPLPADEQLRIFVQLLVPSPTPLSSSAANPPPLLFVPLISSGYTPPTYIMPAARDAEPFYSIDNLSNTNWPAASQISASKLSIHTIGRGDPYMMQFVRTSLPRVIKTVGDFGWMSEVKAVDPGVVILGRVYGQDESWVLKLDPAAAATEYINQNLGHYQGNPAIDYWEGWNEFVWTPGDASRLQWFVQFESARACQMQAKGLKAAVGGFAVGWPNTYAEFEHVLPMIEAAICADATAFRANYETLTYGTIQSMFPEECFLSDVLISPDAEHLDFCGVRFGLLLFQLALRLRNGVTKALK